MPSVRSYNHPLWDFIAGMENQGSDNPLAAFLSGGAETSGRPSGRQQPNPWEATGNPFAFFQPRGGRHGYSGRQQQGSSRPTSPPSEESAPAPDSEKPTRPKEANFEAAPSEPQSIKHHQYGQRHPGKGESQGGCCGQGNRGSQDGDPEAGPADTRSTEHHRYGRRHPGQGGPRGRYCGGGNRQARKSGFPLGNNATDGPTLNDLAQAFQEQLFGINTENNNNNNNNINNTNTNNNTDTATPPNQHLQDFTPTADVFDTPSTYTIHLSLAGAKKEDVAVSWDAEKSELTISGVIYRPGDEEFLKTLALDERREVGAFERKVRLGSRVKPAAVDVEGISAKLEDGVLRVEVPKLGNEGFVEVKRVEVK